MTSIPAPASSPVFELQLKKEGIVATAKEIDGELTVLEGSGGRVSWTGVEHAYKVLHQRLVQEDVIVPGHDGGTMRFARDQVFASPSAAAAVVVGRTANGRHDWTIQGSGISFGNWQAQGIDQAARNEPPAGWESWPWPGLPPLSCGAERSAHGELVVQAAR